MGVEAAHWATSGRLRICLAQIMMIDGRFILLVPPRTPNVPHSLKQSRGLKVRKRKEKAFSCLMMITRAGVMTAKKKSLRVQLAVTGDEDNLQSKRMRTRFLKDTCLVMYTLLHRRNAKEPYSFNPWPGSPASIWVSACADLWLVRCLVSV